MRRWLGLVTLIALLAGTTTALAIGGGESSIDAEGETEKEVQAADQEKIDMVFESIPDGMLEEDDLSEVIKETVEVEETTTTTLDKTAPEIVVLHPIDGQVFERKEVVFEGETEPGARVFAGDYEADVSETGAWRIVLHLYPGENNVKFKAVDGSGNVGTDTVTVVYKVPQKPKAEEPKKEEPPKDEEPKDEEPKEEPQEWEFSAKQLFGECAENPPYDVFHGTGKPGSLIFIESEYGSGVAEVGEKGGWEVKVVFESAPAGKVFPVYVMDEFGHKKVFEFIHTEG